MGAHVDSGFSRFERKHCVLIGIFCVSLFLVVPALMSTYHAAFFSKRILVTDTEFAQWMSRYQLKGGTPSSPVIMDTPEGWEVRKEIAQSQAMRQMRTVEPYGHDWFQNNWEPVVGCAYERRLGSPGDGGKWICNPHLLKKKEKVIVYSLGSENDYSFEQAVYDFFGDRVEIHTFDFGTPVNTPKFVHYHQYLMGGSDTASAKTFRSIVKELGHEQSTIDILKIDIESSEYDLLHAALRDDGLGRVNQLQIEVHLQGRIDPSRAHKMFLELNGANFDIFHKEPNTQFANGNACEFSLVRVTWS